MVDSVSVCCEVGLGLSLCVTVSASVSVTVWTKSQSQTRASGSSVSDGSVGLHVLSDWGESDVLDLHSINLIRRRQGSKQSPGPHMATTMCHLLTLTVVVYCY